VKKNSFLLLELEMADLERYLEVKLGFFVSKEIFVKDSSK
jgi:hypothetical protein